MKNQKNKFMKLSGEDTGSGNSEALFRLGECYRLGQGVEEDFKKAIELYEKASGQNNSNAMIRLGECCYYLGKEDQDLVNAFKLYEKAKKLGNLNAILMLGECYLLGQGVDQDFATAIELYEEAADLDNSDAMFKLGFHYQFEEVTADLFHSVIMNKLGLPYQLRVKVKKEGGKGKKLFIRSLDIELNMINKLEIININNFNFALSIVGFIFRNEEEIAEVSLYNHIRDKKDKNFDKLLKSLLNYLTGYTLDEKELETVMDNQILFEFNWLIIGLLKKLQVREAVAHYTTPPITNKILKEKDDDCFKLFSASNMNDLSEGKLFKKLFAIDEVQEQITLLSCFSFNHAQLNQFRLYGKVDNQEGTGVSIVFNKSFFADSISIKPEEQISLNDLDRKVNSEANIKRPLYRVIYIDDKKNIITRIAENDLSSSLDKDIELNDVSEGRDKYFESIQDRFKTVVTLVDKIKGRYNKISEELKENEVIANKLLSRIRYLFKSDIYHEEQECRIIRSFISDTDKELKVLNEEEISRLCCNYKNDAKNNIEKIYLGPCFKDSNTFKEYIQKKYKKDNNEVIDIEKIDISFNS